MTTTRLANEQLPEMPPEPQRVTIKLTGVFTVEYRDPADRPANGDIINVPSGTKLKIVRILEKPDPDRPVDQLVATCEIYDPELDGLYDEDFQDHLTDHESETT